MTRPLFFTGRKEIARSDVAIRLFENRGQLSHFHAKIDLSRYDVPRNALVVVEAYHNAYYERFEVEAVEGITVNCTRELKGLEPGDRAHFRVKVIGREDVASGQLLAAIDEVRPITDDDTGAGGSLLTLIPKSRDQMGDEFWRVNFLSSDEPHPELWINRDAHGFLASLKNQDPRIISLIMPEVLRQVLRGLVENGVPWTEEGLLGQWLALAKSFHPDEFEEWDEDAEDFSRQRRREWVDAVIRRFAVEHRLFELYHEQLQVTPEGSVDDN